MSIIERIRGFFGKEGALGRNEVRRLQGMPPDQARTELGSILYRECVKQTSDFVQDQLNRSGSPYAGTSAALFFHEILAVTFWIMDKEMADGKKGILSSLHDNYFRAYSSFGRSPEQRTESLYRKYDRYSETWNDVTGHLDEFGFCVVENIFGKEESDRTRERTFWIISYADQTSKRFSSLRRACAEILSRCSDS